jgi:hypothetical protein
MALGLLHVLLVQLPPRFSLGASSCLSYWSQSSCSSCCSSGFVDWSFILLHSSCFILVLSESYHNLSSIQCRTSNPSETPRCCSICSHITLAFWRFRDGSSLCWSFSFLCLFSLFWFIPEISHFGNPPPFAWCFCWTHGWGC